VIVLAIGLGLISAFAIRQEYMIDLAIGIGITSTFAIRQEYIYLSVFSALQVFIIVLPLLVVRSVGYRVVNSNQHKGTENAKPS
jgi:membrane protein CcdC involved in cytochrome C biogenesis